MDKELLIKSVDHVIRTRRSDRAFSDEFPEAEVIKNIIHSAVYAPYGRATGLSYQEIRKIFVLTQNSEKIEKAKELMLEEIRRISAKVNRTMFFAPFLKKKMRSFAHRVNELSKSGVPSLYHAPYYIIIAEKRAFPPVEKQSIAHALQNIWLSATAAGLGFQLITVTGMMSDNKQFCELLGLQKGVYQLDGCVIGIPSTANVELKEFEFDQFVTWL